MEADMQARELLDAVMDDIQKLAKTETIVGEALSVGDATVVPVIRLNVGFGAGGGEGQGTDPKGANQGTGSGGGGGGGIRIEPAAFIVMQQGEISIMAAPGKGGRIAEAFEHLPDLIGELMASRAGKGTKEAGETPEA
jgi:uncharacterized spore protein YtfJ